MADREPSDDLVAAVLRRAVGEPASDLGEVLARGTRVRRSRARRSVALSAAAVLAVAIALWFNVIRAPSTAPEPAHVPHHPQSGGISTGTYSTPPLSAATLLRSGMKPAEIGGRLTVLTLKFERLTADQTERNQNGSYTQFDAEDGGPPRRVTPAPSRSTAARSPSSAAITSSGQRTSCIPPPTGSDSTSNTSPSTIQTSDGSPPSSGPPLRSIAHELDRLSAPNHADRGGFFEGIQWAGLKAVVGHRIGTPLPRSPRIDAGRSNHRDAPGLFLRMNRQSLGAAVSASTQLLAAPRTGDLTVTEQLKRKVGR